jgi:hypothetical protein
MPSIIIMNGSLGAVADIPNDPAQHQALLEGMRRFGAEYKGQFAAKLAAGRLTGDADAAQLIHDVFSAVLVDPYKAYRWHNDDGRFYEIRLRAHNNPDGVLVVFKSFDENGNPVAANKKFKIEASLDEKGYNAKMKVAVPVGDAVAYLRLFNGLAAEDYNNGSTDFFAAATLISRCK